MATYLFSGNAYMSPTRIKTILLISCLMLAGVAFMAIKSIVIDRFNKFEKHSNIFRFILAVILIITAIIPTVFVCNHEQVQLSVVEATCVHNGCNFLVCEDCGETLEYITSKPLDHTFTEYEVTILPSKNKNGVETRTCTECGFTDNREYICPHLTTVSSISKESTCTETGIEDLICEACSTVVCSNIIDAVGHSVESYKITVKPTANNNGIKSGICTTCGAVVEVEFVCAHEKTSTIIVKHATCLNTGVEYKICSVCETVLNESAIDKTGCSYGDWVYTKTATPVENGERYRVCKVCGYKNTENYTVSMPAKNSIYIPNTNVIGELVVAPFTQSSVDSYDIVYSESSPYFNVSTSDPFVLGHNYGTMGYIYQVKVGQLIYLSVNGELRTYKVVVSEFAVQNAAHTDIVGQTSNISVFSTGKNLWGASQTLHMYTCYKNTPNGYNQEGRWIVMAVRV